LAIQKFKEIKTENSPQPAGTYSQAILAQGPFLVQNVRGILGGENKEFTKVSDWFRHQE